MLLGRDVLDELRGWTSSGRSAPGTPSPSRIAQAPGEGGAPQEGENPVAAIGLIGPGLAGAPSLHRRGLARGNRRGETSIRGDEGHRGDRKWLRAWLGEFETTLRAGDVL